MLSLIYSSLATRHLEDDDLAALLAQSRRANAENDITGVLLFRNGYFLQLLEGPDQAVRDKMATIKHDDRHTKVSVLVEELVEERQFPEWTMGFPAEDSDVEQAPGYRTTFDDLDAAGGAQVSSLPALRELIRWFRPAAG
ncbi:BLUF domain-containing protein [Curtobacterium sp. MCLR17_036]|uniref:BLUF domain-containing protein n=1 Tax=Curtobacterium sp. MCLR17_036 TaxID=2175620 RepID=UPI000DAA27F9|nr:BLUF domain-containing protein [Curtobacterium sp. MCLR17_036]WIE65083.1 BLUF domain-containing protein [Curtobacterium sp. MCLR17_036]